MSRTEILKTLSDAIGAIKIRSVVDNLSRLILIIMLIIVVAAVFKIPEWLLIVFCSVLGISLLLMVYAYVYFSIKKPDYLRSEDYHLRKQSIEMLGDKENYLPLDLSEIRGIANPYDETKVIDSKAIEVEEDTDE